MKKITASFLLIFCSCFAYSQLNPVSIQTIIFPPHSPYLSSYINNPNKALVTVVNASSKIQNLRFILSIKGDNGISFSTNSNYKPAAPLVMQPGQQKVMNSSNTELKNYFSTSNMTIVGISKSDLIQSDALPEGNYEICLKALDYNTGAPLSDDAPQGCAQISISYIDPPIIIQPQCGEDKMATFPQNIVFSWSPPTASPAGIEYIFTLKEIPISIKAQASKSNQLNPNDVIKNAAYPVLYTATVKSNSMVYNNAMPILAAGKTYVWRVQAKSKTNSVSFKQEGYTEACVLNFTAPKFIETINPGIKLFEPKDKAEIAGPTNEAGKGISFSWENLLNSKFAYEVHIVKINEKQSPKDAFDKNPLAVNDEKGGKYKAPYIMNYYLAPGNYAWKVIYADYNNTKNQLESEIRTFSIPQGDTALISKFSICNTDVFVTKTTNNDINMFSGEGYVMYLKTTKLPVKFDGIKVAHTKKEKGKKMNWKCYQGYVQGAIKGIVNSLEPQGDLEGVFNYTPKHISYEASITPKYNDATSVYTVEEGDKGEGHTTKLYAELEWISPIIIKEGSTYGGSPIPLNKGNNAFGGMNFTLFTRKISANQNEGFKFEHDTKLVLSNPEDVVLKFDKGSYLSVVGNKVYANFSGEYSVFSGKKLLGIMPIFHNFKFTYATGMLIKGYAADGLPFKIYWDKNKTVQSEFSESYLRLGESKPYEAPTSKKGIFIYPNFKIQYLKDKYVDLSMTYMYNSGKGYEISKNKAVNTISLSKFKAETDKLKIQIYESKLAVMDLKGNLIVPFVNMKAPFSLYADNENKPSFDIQFDSKETSTVIDNATQKVVATPISAKMISEDEIRFTGYFDFISKSENSDQTFAASNVKLKNIIIKPDNSIETGWIPSYFEYQTSGLYNGFDFKLSQYRCMTKNGKPTIRLIGDIVLEEGSIAPQEKVQIDLAMNPLPYPKMPSEYYTTSASAEKMLFTPPANDVEISSNKFKAKSVNNGCTDFEVSFEYKNDAVYGKGFVAEADVSIKEPMQGKIHTKVMVGKAVEGYKYWFLEAGQQGLVNVPTGILDIGIYGFAGRIYYHMGHQEGGNIDASNYIPNNQIGYGIYALANLKTLSNEGKVLWGTLSTEVATASSGGLYPIKIRGEAFILSDGVDDINGAMVHGVADLTINVMSPRYFAGIIDVDANVKDLVQVHAPLTLHMGDGQWYLHLGTPENMMTAYVPDLDKTMSGFVTLDKIGGNARLGLGVEGEIFGFHKVKKKCFLVCCFKAGADVGISGKLTAYAQVPSFQMGGTVSLSAYAKVCASACGVGGCPGISATMNGAFEFPDPFCVAGGLTLITPNGFPNFTIKVRYKDGSIGWSDNCQ